MDHQTANKRTRFHLVLFASLGIASSVGGIAADPPADALKTNVTGAPVLGGGCSDPVLACAAQAKSVNQDGQRVFDSSGYADCVATALGKCKVNVATADDATQLRSDFAKIINDVAQSGAAAPAAESPNLTAADNTSVRHDVLTNLRCALRPKNQKPQRHSCQILITHVNVVTHLKIGPTGERFSLDRTADKYCLATDADPVNVHCVSGDPEDFPPLEPAANPDSIPEIVLTYLPVR